MMKLKKNAGSGQTEDVNMETDANMNTLRTARK